MQGGKEGRRTLWLDKEGRGESPRVWTGNPQPVWPWAWRLLKRRLVSGKGTGPQTLLGAHAPRFGPCSEAVTPLRTPSPSRHCATCQIAMCYWAFPCRLFFFFFFFAVAEVGQKCRDVSKTF